MFYSIYRDYILQYKTNEKTKRVKIMLKYMVLREFLGVEIAIFHKIEFDVFMRWYYLWY